MSIQTDTAVVRGLAQQYMEIALSERHVKMRQRFRDSNDLKIVRPPLIMEEIQWTQMNYEHELDCVCENAELRGMEYGLRCALLREKYFRCDNYIEPCWVVYKSYSSTGNGMEAKDHALGQGNTYIASHMYEDVLEDESSLEAFHNPVITAYPENDMRNVAHIQEILGDSIPVVLRGHTIYYAPWDQIARLRGVEPILCDIYERPEYLHRIISLYTEAMKSEMEQMSSLGLYDTYGISLHCTPYDVTPPEGCDTRYPVWFRTMAQMFSSISPEAHYEFDMQYSIPLAEKCGYTYYGCCEPLHDRIEQVERYKNLRKIGATPWADLEKMADATRGKYVLSRKPNPANVAVKTDPEVVKKEIEDTVKICLKYGCPCDITLKDISTMNEDPTNLMVWAKAASEVLDYYYGEE